MPQSSEQGGLHSDILHLFSLLSFLMKVKVLSSFTIRSSGKGTDVVNLTAKLDWPVWNPVGWVLLSPWIIASHEIKFYHCHMFLDSSFYIFWTIKATNIFVHTWNFNACSTSPTLSHLWRHTIITPLLDLHPSFLLVASVLQTWATICLLHLSNLCWSPSLWVCWPPPSWGLWSPFLGSVDHPSWGLAPSRSAMMHLIMLSLAVHNSSIGDLVTN